MSNNVTISIELAKRVRELEAELKQTKAERDALLKQIKEQSK